MRNYLGLGHVILIAAFGVFFGGLIWKWRQPPAEPPFVEELSQQELEEVAGDVGDGWFKDEGNWYYYEDGEMVKSQWVEGSYYVGQDGIMLHDTVTPDGHVVGANGAVVSQ